MAKENGIGSAMVGGDGTWRQQRNGEFNFLLYHSWSRVGAAHSKWWDIQHFWPSLNIGLCCSIHDDDTIFFVGVDQTSKSCLNRCSFFSSSTIERLLNSLAKTTAYEKRLSHNKSSKWTMTGWYDCKIPCSFIGRCVCSIISLGSPNWSESSFSASIGSHAHEYEMSWQQALKTSGCWSGVCSKQPRSIQPCRSGQVYEVYGRVWNIFQL